MYKTLGFSWLLEVFCPASAFVSAYRYEARNPQRFIHVTVMGNYEEETVDDKSLRLNRIKKRGQNMFQKMNAQNGRNKPKRP